MPQLDEVLFLFARRHYATRVVTTDRGPVLLLDQEDPEGGAAIDSCDRPEHVLEIWQNGDLLALDAAGIGTLKFESADELDRFVHDLLSRGWVNLHHGDYRIIP